MLQTGTKREAVTQSKTIKGYAIVQQGQNQRAEISTQKQDQTRMTQTK